LNTASSVGLAPAPPNWTLERVLRISARVAVVAALAMTAWLFAGLIAYLVVGFVIAYLVRPVTQGLEGLGLSRTLSIGLTFMGLIGAVVVLLTVLVPFIAVQVRDLTQQITPEVIAGLAGTIEGYIQVAIPLQDGAFYDGVMRAFTTLVQYDSVADAVSLGVSLFTDVFYAVIIIPFVTFFFLKDGGLIRRYILGLVPNKYLETTVSTAEKLELSIGRYFRALILQCTSVGLVAFLLLSGAGLETALAVGIFTGLANAIPYFGPVMGFLVGSVAGVVQTGDFSLIPRILVAMTATQLMDNLVFQPAIFSRAARAHPLVVLFAVLVGAQLGGLVGMLIAIPVLTTALVITSEIRWSLQNYRILNSRLQ
jgi:predicted PurR-regulated permease PerM